MQEQNNEIYGKIKGYIEFPPEKAEEVIREVAIKREFPSLKWIILAGFGGIAIGLIIRYFLKKSE